MFSPNNTLPAQSTPVQPRYTKAMLPFPYASKVQIKGTVRILPSSRYRSTLCLLCVQVQRCTLLSIKTGGCPENCNYCSQSSHWSKDTGLKAEKLMDLEEVYQVGLQFNARKQHCVQLGTQLEHVSVWASNIRHGRGMHGVHQDVQGSGEVDHRCIPVGAKKMFTTSCTGRSYKSSWSLHFNPPCPCRLPFVHEMLAALASAWELLGGDPHRCAWKHPGQTCLCGFACMGPSHNT